MKPVGFILILTKARIIPCTKNTDQGRNDCNRLINNATNGQNKKIIDQNKGRSDQNALAYRLRIRQGHAIGIDQKTENRKNRIPCMPGNNPHNAHNSGKQKSPFLRDRFASANIIEYNVTDHGYRVQSHTGIRTDQKIMQHKGTSGANLKQNKLFTGLHLEC